MTLFVLSDSWNNFPFFVSILFILYYELCNIYWNLYTSIHYTRHLLLHWQNLFSASMLITNTFIIPEPLWLSVSYNYRIKVKCPEAKIIFRYVTVNLCCFYYYYFAVSYSIPHYYFFTVRDTFVQRFLRSLYWVHWVIRIRVVDKI